MPFERPDALANEAMGLASGRKGATRSMLTSASMLQKRGCVSVYRSIVMVENGLVAIGGKCVGNTRRKI